jgi:hypothetical protein
MHSLSEWNYLSSRKLNLAISFPACHTEQYGQGSSTCSQHCPAGQFVDGNHCSACAAGTFSGADASSCTSCPINTFSGSGASTCTPCQSGATSPPVSEIQLFPSPPSVLNNMDRAHRHALSSVLPDSSLTATIVPHVLRELLAQWMLRHAQHVPLTHSLVPELAHAPLVRLELPLIL